MSQNIVIEKEKDLDNGQITYANEVIATIVSVATTEVEGISGIAGSGAISGILAKGKTPRGVKVDMNGEDINVDVSVTVDYGMPIQKVVRNAQENVRKAIESMTDLHVVRVDVHVQGVSFEKENSALSAGTQVMLEGENAPVDEAPVAEPVVEEAPAEEEEPAQEEEPVAEQEAPAAEAEEAEEAEETTEA